MQKNDKHINEALKNIPYKPGIYQYFDSKGKIIYIGKAKDLNKRVRSYFNRNTYDNNKLRLLVKKIYSIKYIVTESESDALLLENNLIKKYQPRYNILLKDDKTFPWICIKNERFPRVFSTRNIVKDGSEYFGPYSSAHMVKILIELIRQLYPLRTCRHLLSEEKIKKNSYKVCLEYHIGNCKGPCIGLQTEENYNESIEHIKKILKGNIQEVINYLQKLMDGYAGSHKFEKAQAVKEKLELLKKYKSKSTVVSNILKNVDVFSFEEYSSSAYVHYLKLIDGRIVQAHTVELKKKLNESKEDLLLFAIIEMRERFDSKSKELIVPFKVSFDVKGIKTTVPQRGDKKHLLELSQRNLKYYILEKRKRESKIQVKHSSNRLLNKIKEDLNLRELPVHMECFDNSNIQGTNPVAACVVFKNGKPNTSEYRHYNIKTVRGPDDYASMEEVIYRRYKRLLEEERTLPQLVIIDGGKGQLNAALKSISKLGLEDRIQLVGIAKRLEEIFVPGESLPLYIDKKSESLKTIQHLRNEAHRFGIKFHRNKRSLKFTESELDKIKGIGEKTKIQLLRKFHTVHNISKASEKELTEEIGQSKASLIYKHFHKNIILS